MISIIRQLHTVRVPSKGSSTLSARVPTQRHGGQSSPYSAPTRPNITIIVKAEADRDAFGFFWTDVETRPARNCPYLRESTVVTAIRHWSTQGWTHLDSWVQ